jgi:hypothetical protein
MDYGNAILYGINNNVLSKLQRVQNTAARLITRKRKYDHPSEVILLEHELLTIPEDKQEHAQSEL